MRLAIVIPFRDEAEHLPRLLASMAAQDRPPDRLVLVDDGSEDASAALAADFAAAHPYAELLRRERRPAGRDRLATAPEWRAFRVGLSRLEEPFDVVAKMDGDLELSPRTLLELERRFAADPRLGIAGAVLTSVDAEGVPVRHRSPDAHVDGATKFYRRACFEEISPVPPILGWDTIDEACARMHGWRTRSFPVSGGVLHLRPMGTHDGLPRAFRRWGACAWAYGEPPAVVLLMALQRAADPPAVLGAANYLVGWAAAALRRAPRAKPEVRAFVRADQLGRLRRRLRGHVTRQAVAEAAP